MSNVYIDTTRWVVDLRDTPLASSIYVIVSSPLEVQDTIVRWLAARGYTFLNRVDSPNKYSKVFSPDGSEMIVDWNADLSTIKGVSSYRQDGLIIKSDNPVVI